MNQDIEAQQPGTNAKTIIMGDKDDVIDEDGDKEICGDFSYDSMDSRITKHL